MTLADSSHATVAITGSSGLIGSALMANLAARGRSVVPIARDDISQSAAFRGADVVVHLAGEPVATGRWTVAKMDRIRRSRLEVTQAMCQSLAGLERPPKVLASASAVGFYGNRGDETLDEDSPGGQGFLAEVCRDWEAATEHARAAGIRVVCMRFGMILSPSGGALAKMLTPFRLGLGGRIGSGRQYVSWIAIDDAVDAVCHAVTTDSLAGPVNCVSPQPVSNAEFTAALGRALRRPTVAPFPTAAARLLFGRMADDLLLCSVRVLPRRLESTGFIFHHSDLESALRFLLRKGY